MDYLKYFNDDVQSIIKEKREHIRKTKGHFHLVFPPLFILDDIDDITKNMIIAINIDKESIMDDSIYISTINTYLSNIVFYIKRIVDGTITDTDCIDKVCTVDKNIIAMFNILRQKCRSLIPHLNGKYRHIKPNLSTKDTFKSAGIDMAMLIKSMDHFKDSRIAPREILNLLDISDENFLKFKQIDASVNLQCRFSIQYITDNIDIQLWKHVHEKWLNKSCEFNYKGHKISVDHYNIIAGLIKLNINKFLDYITPYKNFKKSPSHILKDKELSAYIDKYLQYVYDIKYNDEPFNIDHRFVNTDRLTILKDPIALRDEGITMNHCVGGDDYRAECHNGNSIIAHIDNDTEKGFTVEFKKVNDTFIIKQAYGAKNSRISSVDQLYINDYLSQITSPW